MKLSTDRILTTHVGSLPRPQALVDLLVKKDQDQPYDHAEFDREVTKAVADIVAHQVAVGIDVVSDGEASKIGYATYIKDRLTGFGGEPFMPKPQRDLADYPDFRKRMIQFTGPQVFRRLCCIGDVQTQRPRGGEGRHRQLQGGDRPRRIRWMRSCPRRRRASCRRSSRTGTIPTTPPISAPWPMRCRRNTRRSPMPASSCSSTAPIWRWRATPDSRTSAKRNSSSRRSRQVEALNHALANVPASSARLHLCWGNYEGPHDFDIPLQKVLPIILKAKPQAISFEAANPRHAHEWAVWKEAKIPDDKVLIPGVIDTCTNYIEHPELVSQRICQFADIVGRERVHRRYRLRLCDVRRSCRPRRSGDRLPQARRAGGRREAGIREAVALRSAP